MKVLIKILTDKQLMSSIVSVVGAIVAACAAGCKLTATDICVEVNPYPSHTNLVEVVR